MAVATASRAASEACSDVAYRPDLYWTGLRAPEWLQVRECALDFYLVVCHCFNNLSWAKPTFYNGLPELFGCVTTSAALMQSCGAPCLSTWTLTHPPCT